MSRIECLTEAELTAFLLGETPETVLDEIAEHLELCDRCESAAKELDDLSDPAIAALRHAGPGGTAPVNTQPPPPAEVPDKIGPYEILGEVGRGGMGVVYKARHEGLRRLVALKMMLIGRFADADHRARFRQEAETVARLQHPNIVQLFDVGEYEGQPYFTLEFMDGGSLGDLVGKPQHPSQAARWLETLARAVHHAHREGIVHRDLKPDNVLLAPPDPAMRSRGEGGGNPGFGSLKVADFGIAKLAEGSNVQTRSGVLVGTPEFMAPEQAATGTDVGPRADIYALGAILYTLLAGRPPLQAAGALETLELVKRQEPVPLRRLQPQLPRDLETICAKCLQKEPARRYDSAEELAEDLRRHLDGRPILARPVGAAGRLWRWGRRNPLAAGLCAALGLVVTASLAAVTGLWLHAESQREWALEERDDASAARDEAEDNLELAERAVDECFILATEEPLLQGERMKPARRLLFEKALPFFEGFRVSRSDDPAVRAKIAEYHFKVGVITLELGREDAAVGSFEQARSLFTRLIQDDAGSPMIEFTLGQTHNNLGILYARLGRVEDAGRAYLSAQATFQGLVDGYPTVREYRNYLAKARLNFGTFLLQTAPGRSDDALGLFQAVASLLESDGLPESPDRRCDLAAVYSNLGNLQFRLVGRVHDATETLSKAHRHWEHLAEEYPDVLRYQIGLSDVRYQLASLRFIVGGPSEGDVESWNAECNRWEQLAKANPGVAAVRRELAQSYNSLSFASLRAGRAAESLEASARSREVCEELVNTNPDILGYRTALATSYRCAGSAHISRGDLPAAERSLEQARDIYDRMAASREWDFDVRLGLAQAEFALGEVRRSRNRTAEAEESYNRSVTLMETLLRHEPTFHALRDELSDIYNNLANLRAQTGDWPGAAAFHEKARDLQEEFRGDDGVPLGHRGKLGRTYAELAIAYRSCGRWADARECFEKSLSLQEESAGGNIDQDAHQADLALTYTEYAVLLGAANRKAAREYFQRALTILEELATSGRKGFSHHEHLARTLNQFGIFESEAGRVDASRQRYDRARVVLGQLVQTYPQVGRLRVDLGGALVNLGNTYSVQSTPASALPYFGEAIEHLGKALAKSPGLPRATLYLRNAYWCRAEALVMLDRYDESISDWDRAIELESGPFRHTLRLYRARAVVLGGDHGHADSASASLAQPTEPDGPLLYLMARVHSLASAEASKDPDFPELERRREADRHADEAIKMLRMAHAAEFFNSPGQTNMLGAESDFIPLREAKAFREFVERLHPASDTSKK